MYFTIQPVSNGLFHVYDEHHNPVLMNAEGNSTFTDLFRKIIANPRSFNPEIQGWTVTELEVCPNEVNVWAYPDIDCGEYSTDGFSGLRSFPVDITGKRNLTPQDIVNLIEDDTDEIKEDIEYSFNHAYDDVKEYQHMVGIESRYW